MYFFSLKTVVVTAVLLYAYCLIIRSLNDTDIEIKNGDVGTLVFIYNVRRFLIPFYHVLRL